MKFNNLIPKQKHHPPKKKTPKGTTFHILLRGVDSLVPSLCLQQAWCGHGFHSGNGYDHIGSGELTNQPSVFRSERWSEEWKHMSICQLNTIENCDLWFMISWVLLAFPAMDLKTWSIGLRGSDFGSPKFLERDLWVGELDSFSRHFL